MHMAVLPCQFTRKGQLYATVQIGNEVVEVLVVFSRKRGFQLRVRQRRGIDELVAITSVYRCIRFVPSPYTVLTFDLSHFRVRSLVFLF